MNDYPLYPYFSKQIKCEEQEISFPPQHQERQPGLEYLMDPRPIFDNPSYIGNKKLINKTAIITGGDSGIGRAVAVAFAKEGADVAIAYLDEHEDAEETKEVVERLGRRCILLPTDLRFKENCVRVVEQTINTFGKIDILVNNCAVQYPQENLTDITEQQLVHTFATNIFSYFFMAQAAMPHLKQGSAIINTASVTSYYGHKTLIDYSATKGAIVSFTRALGNNLADQGIRVNAVAPGPFWTPLIPASMTVEDIATFGTDVPMKRAGQPFELAPAYVYLASHDSQYVTGQTLHVNGAEYTSS
ncbi:SDR family oxidoreductase [Neobacillus sp. PS3-12]|uniref:SDR family oxidoreductase n=1 Tax=Neobacillus sp. PS3-12 TaxID=3070677 RepID=UPI0027DEE6F8|nr:SDR family oxidoreductase [Neobacillus sp. PS3-12]WML53663.1 SDR family oxidoreductase [Neobacillus sp. PS3-12]